jgi:hypothetical protein
MTAYGKIFFTLYVVFLFPLLCMSQQFKYSAALEAVDTTGFYTIVISPSLSAYVKTDFADIRIANETKQWIPHILQQHNERIENNFFTPFPILQNTVTDSGSNLLIIENTKPAGIYNLKLFLKNAAVNRTASFSGSNDQHHWYIIDDKIAIHRSNEISSDEYLQEINFPLSKYRFLKLNIDNAHNDPLLITKAGFYSNTDYKKLRHYVGNPTPLFTQKDSNNYSYIQVSQDMPYQFDKILLTLSGSKFYSREVEIRYPAFDKNHIAKPGVVIGDFKLQSGLPALFELPRTNNTVFFIVIKNSDNPPLKIEKVSTQQQIISIVTYLEKGKKYDLLFGNSMANFANYDLQLFKDSVTNLRELSYGTITSVTNATTLKNDDNKKKWWIWPAIIFAGIVLSFLTYKMTGEINQSKK